jgi:hypothetical protein
MHFSINSEEIKTEIEKLGHTVTSVWNINNTELHAFVELKPAPNNKDIFSVQNKFQTQAVNCSMCKLSKTRAQQKLLPSQTEMSQMRR